jgi:hypothetical protein
VSTTQSRFLIFPHPDSRFSSLNSTRELTLLARDQIEILRTAPSWSHLLAAFAGASAASSSLEPGHGSGKQAAADAANAAGSDSADPHRPCLVRRGRLGAAFDAWMPLSEAPAHARDAFAARSASAALSASSSSSASAAASSSADGTAAAAESLPVEATEFRALLRGLLPVLRMCPSQRYQQDTRQ